MTKRTTTALKRKSTPSVSVRGLASLKIFALNMLSYLRRNWKGTVVILFATTVFFGPLITRISSYSEGGDAMFNAWTLARNQHCILGQGCPNYADGNIYFPNKDSMLFSETQLSAGFLTMPLYFINNNPLFSYNVLTIMSFFLSGWFMYLLAKRLSKGNELFSIMAGLIFEFAPLKIAAVSHLQNISIFYLPLAFLLILKYFELRTRKWLVALFVVLSLQFYASWYQMVFVLIALGVFLTITLMTKYVQFMSVLMVSIAVFLAIVSTLPLAKQYIRFSKANSATFSISEQSKYSSSLADYAIPNNGTLLGEVYYKLRPQSKVNSYNPDSYSYHGMVLYAVALIIVAVTYRRRREDASSKNNYQLVLALVAVGFIGFLISLGPLLKMKGSETYIDQASGLKLAVPLPYILMGKVFPQLSFIRAIGRASVLTLFALCGLLALAPAVLRPLSMRKYWKTFTIAVCLLVIFELMPAHRYGRVSPTANAYSYNLSIPDVYRVVKRDKDIDNLVILNADKDYPNAPIPVARAEWVLWSGYHNKNIFNGYSGYTPPDYFSQYDDFVDLKADDIPKMQKLGIRYVLIDKQLSKSTSLAENAKSLLSQKKFEDGRYILYKL